MHTITSEAGYVLNTETGKWTDPKKEDTQRQGHVGCGCLLLIAMVVIASVCGYFLAHGYVTLAVIFFIFWVLWFLFH